VPAFTALRGHPGACAFFENLGGIMFFLAASLINFVFAHFLHDPFASFWTLV
jgi:hypothetical protein